MAAKYPGREDEKRQLEEMMKMTFEEKKAVFENTKDADEKLWKIREKEMTTAQKRLQKNGAEEIERDRRERYEACSDVELNELRQRYEALKSQNAEQCTSLRKMKDVMKRTTGYSNTQRKEKEQALRQVVGLKNEIAALRSQKIGRDQRERYEADVGPLDAELNKLSQKCEALEVENSELRKGQKHLVATSLQYELEALKSSLKKVKDAMQRITSYAKIQEKGRLKALGLVASLEDEISALRQISAETQQRQLNELQPTSTSIEHQQPQQQHRKGKADS